MSLPQLPIPDLTATLNQVVDAAAALSPTPSTPEAPSLAQAAEDFLRGPGARLQQDLQAFAARENAQGRSWLEQEWLRGYDATRTPLPLTSSVAFSLQLPQRPPTPESLADAIHEIAAPHLEWVRGDFPQAVGARGEELDMSQFAALAGGLRHPLPDVDEFRSPTPPSPGSGWEIGVLLNGRLFTLVVADDAGRPLRPDLLAHRLQGICSAVFGDRTSGPTPDPSAHLPGGFAGFSCLGSAELAPVLDELLREESNAVTYERLKNLLFTVTVVAGPDDAEAPDADPDGRTAALLSTLLEPGRAWAYRPISYVVNLRGSFWSAHVEHSTFDGGMLADAVQRMQPRDPESARPTARDTFTDPVELRWEVSTPLVRTISDAIAAYRDQAHRLKAVRLALPRVPDDELPFGMSLDALHQVVLTTAQVLAYGRVRSAYESVDMRGFRGGRTECLRPVTPEAVDFATALVADRATLDLLQEMLRAHRVQVKACKTGQGFERHLLGLEMMADRAGIRPPFLSDPALKRLHTDFLSTTSLGSPDQVIDYAFAPTVPEGFGVCYTPYATSLGFLVTWWDDTAETPDAFLAALKEAADLLCRFLRRLASVRAVEGR
jgi:hypothetical protein